MAKSEEKRLKKIRRRLVSHMLEFGFELADIPSYAIGLRMEFEAQKGKVA